MSIKWKKDLQPKQIVEKIESLRGVTDTGKVQFKSFEFQVYNSILFGMIDFLEIIPDEEAQNILWRSLVSVGSIGVITTNNLIAEANKKYNKYLASPIQRFSLLTSLSIQLDNSVRTIRVGRDQLIFDNVPGRFFREAKTIKDKASYHLCSEPPKNYLPVRVHVSGRSIHDAAYRVLELLDLVRTIWNLILNIH